MKVKIGDITKIKTGKLDANASSEDGEYPFFTCSKEPLRISTYSYDCECVLVAGNGDLNVKYYNGKFDAYQRTYIIEDNSDGRLFMPYLYYFMEGYVEELRKQAIGGVIKYIKLGNLTDAMIELPDVEIQKKIVNILSKTKKVLDSRSHQIDMLNNLIKARFIELFGSSPEGNITIQECCKKIVGGGTPSMQHPEYYGGDIPFIKSGDVKTDRITTGALSLTPKALTSGRAKLVPEGIVIVVIRSAALLHEFHVAVTDNSVVINQDLKALYPAEGIVPEFLMWSIKSQEQYLLSKVQTMLTSHIPMEILLDLKVHKATLDEQMGFVKFAERVNKSKVVVQKAFDETQMLYDSLLQEFFG